jgi:hypothetical protein
LSRAKDHNWREAAVTWLTEANRSSRQTTTVKMFVATIDSVAFIKIWIQGWPNGVDMMAMTSFPSVEKTVTVITKANV